MPYKGTGSREENAAAAGLRTMLGHERRQRNKDTARVTRQLRAEYEQLVQHLRAELRMERDAARTYRTQLATVQDELKALQRRGLLARIINKPA